MIHDDNIKLKSCIRFGSRSTAGDIRALIRRLGGSCAPAHPPADPDDADTIVVDPPSPCESLGAFFDGELGQQQRATFRDHLANCSACERGLLALMLIEAHKSTR